MAQEPGYDIPCCVMTNGHMASGLQDPPKYPTTIYDIELGKPFVVLNKVGIPQGKLTPQVAEELAKS